MTLNAATPASRARAAAWAIAWAETHLYEAPPGEEPHWDAMMRYRLTPEQVVRAAKAAAEGVDRRARRGMDSPEFAAWVRRRMGG